MTLHGRTQRMHWQEQNKDMFKDIEWWEPEIQGQPLSEADVRHISEYTGSFSHSLNVGKALRGLAPHLVSEDPRGGWRETSDRGLLAQDVLRFSVALATALNKLPCPSTPKELYRGAWLSPPIAKYLLTKPTGVRLPWFQPTTSDDRHSYMFMNDRFAPENCRSPHSSCVENNVAYPVRFIFTTSRAKDVTKWNMQEHEHIILPNLPFDVVSAAEVMNDPLASMGTQELSEWLSRKHGLPAWVQHRTGLLEAGPFPEAAAKVRRKGLTGRQLAQAGRGNGIMAVVEEVGISWKDAVRGNLHEVLQARYQLAEQSPTEPNSFPYYIEVSLQDADL